MQADPTPFIRSTAPRDGCEFLGNFLTDNGPRFAPTRFENGRWRWKKNGEWSDTSNRDTLRFWGELGPTIIPMSFAGD